MLRQFSVGQFLDITSSDEELVRRRVDQLKNVPGLQHVEVYLENVDISDALIEYVKENFSQLRTIVHAPFVNISLAGRRITNEASVRVLQQAYDIGERWGAEVFTIHAGLVSQFQSFESSMAVLAESLSLLKTRSSCHVTLENMPQRRQEGMMLPLFDTVMSLERALPFLPFVGITLDIGHAIQNDEDWRAWFVRNKSKIYNIHFHDALRNGKGHLTLGSGHLDAHGFLSFLLEQGYDRFLSSEVVGEQQKHDSWNYMSAFLQTV